MPKRALVEKRPWLLASLAAAIAYYLLKDAAFPGTYLYLLEAAALLLLAVYAKVRHPGRDAATLAGVMALSGLGVVGVELDLYIGTVILILGLALAISLFLQHRRDAMSGTQKAAAVAVLLLVPVICWRLPFDRSQAVTIGTYGLALGGMAATAWVSRFPRYRVGSGALMYVAASIVSIAAFGPLSGSAVPSLIAWPLFYLGHFLICTGVIQTLRLDADD